MASYLLIESSSGIIRSSIEWDGISLYDPGDGFYLELPTSSAYDIVPDTSSILIIDTPILFFYTGSYTGSLTGSFNDYSGSLGWLDTFASSSRTGSFTGLFTGSLLGTSSNASTASYVSNIKSGKVTSGEWVVELVGNNYTASVLLSSSYLNSSYAVSLTCGADVRTLSVTNKTPSGFNINSNSTSAMTDDVYWVTVPYNNP